MYRTCNGSEKYKNGKRQNQDRVPVTIHWPKDFGVWTQDKETSSGSIPNGGVDIIFCNNVRILENRKRKAYQRQRKVQ